MPYDDLNSTQVMIDTSFGPKVFTYCKKDKTLLRGSRLIILGNSLDVDKLEETVKDLLMDEIEKKANGEEVHVNIEPIYYHLEQEGFYE